MILDTDAFRFFAPKELHLLLPRFDAFLAQLSEQHEDVAAYLQNPMGSFPIEKRFPIIHLTALLYDGDWHLIRVPRSKYERKDGHRFVDESGQPTIHGMQPVLRLEVVTDPSLTAIVGGAKQLHRQDKEVPKEELKRLLELTKATGDVAKPAVLFSAPLAMLVTPHARRFLLKRFTVYQHIFGAGHEYPDDGPFYIGITARDWKTRWAEHLTSIRNGSKLLFHREYRNRMERKRMTFVHHKVMGVADSLDQVQTLEENLVRGHWEDARRLNMIPGGKAGLAYMREHGMLAHNVRPIPEFAERTLESWLRDNPRKGLPAPWVSELWKNDEYALSVICGPEGRLSVEQVRAIRDLALEGEDPEEIVKRVGARNVAQVCRVIEGKTYSRVSS